MVAHYLEQLGAQLGLKAYVHSGLQMQLAVGGILLGILLITIAIGTVVDMHGTAPYHRIDSSLAKL